MNLLNILKYISGEHDSKTVNSSLNVFFSVKNIHNTLFSKIHKSEK